MNKSKISYLLILIVLSNTACVKRVVVEPKSPKLQKSDFIEVQLKSGEKFVLKNVKVYEEYLEGEHRNEVIQIDYSDIQAVETVNRDYRKVLTYYMIGFSIAVLVGYLLRSSGWGELWFD